MTSVAENCMKSAWKALSATLPFRSCCSRSPARSSSSIELPDTGEPNTNSQVYVPLSSSRRSSMHSSRPPTVGLEPGSGPGQPEPRLELPNQPWLKYENLGYSRRRRSIGDFSPQDATGGLGMRPWDSQEPESDYRRNFEALRRVQSTTTILDGYETSDEGPIGDQSTHGTGESSAYRSRGRRRPVVDDSGNLHYVASGPDYIELRGTPPRPLSQGEITARPRRYLRTRRTGLGLFRRLYNSARLRDPTTQRFRNLAPTQNTSIRPRRSSAPEALQLDNTDQQLRPLRRVPRRDGWYPRTNPTIAGPSSSSDGPNTGLERTQASQGNSIREEPSESSSTRIDPPQSGTTSGEEEDAAAQQLYMRGGGPGSPPPPDDGASDDKGVDKGKSKADEGKPKPRSSSRLSAFKEDDDDDFNDSFDDGPPQNKPGPSGAASHGTPFDKPLIPRPSSFKDDDFDDFDDFLKDDPPHDKPGPSGAASHGTPFNKPLPPRPSSFKDDGLDDFDFGEFDDPLHNKPGPSGAAGQDTSSSKPPPSIGSPTPRPPPRGFTGAQETTLPYRTSSPGGTAGPDASSNKSQSSIGSRIPRPSTRRGHIGAQHVPPPRQKPGQGGGVGHGTPFNKPQSSIGSSTSSPTTGRGFISPQHLPPQRQKPGQGVGVGHGTPFNKPQSSKSSPVSSRTTSRGFISPNDIPPQIEVAKRGLDRSHVKRNLQLSQSLEEFINFGDDDDPQPSSSRQAPQNLGSSTAGHGSPASGSGRDGSGSQASRNVDSGESSSSAERRGQGSTTAKVSTSTEAGPAPKPGSGNKKDDTEPRPSMRGGSGQPYGYRRHFPLASYNQDRRFDELWRENQKFRQDARLSKVDSLVLIYSDRSWIPMKPIYADPYITPRVAMVKASYFNYIRRSFQERKSPRPRQWIAPHHVHQAFQETLEAMANKYNTRFFSKSGTAKPPSPALGQLFDKYRDDPENEKDKISIQGTMSYFQALDVSLDEPAMLAVSTLLKSPTMGEILREDFISGWDTRHADSIPKQKSAVQDMRKQLAGAANADFFKQVYKHSFLLARQPGQRAVMLDAAGEFWRMLFGMGGLKWQSAGEDWLELWIEFLEKEWKKSVSKDLWDQTLAFARKTLEDGSLGWWSEESAWPGVVDEFVAWMKKRREEGERMDTA